MQSSEREKSSNVMSRDWIFRREEKENWTSLDSFVVLRAIWTLALVPFQIWLWMAMIPFRMLSFVLRQSEEGIAPYAASVSRQIKEQKGEELKKVKEEKPKEERKEVPKRRREEAAEKRKELPERRREEAVKRREVVVERRREEVPEIKKSKHPIALDREKERQVGTAAIVVAPSLISDETSDLSQISPTTLSILQEMIANSTQEKKKLNVYKVFEQRELPEEREVELKRRQKHEWRMSTTRTLKQNLEKLIEEAESIASSSNSAKMTKTAAQTKDLLFQLQSVRGERELIMLPKLQQKYDALFFEFLELREELKNSQKREETERHREEEKKKQVTTEKVKPKEKEKQNEEYLKEKQKEKSKKKPGEKEKQKAEPLKEKQKAEPLKEKHIEEKDLQKQQLKQQCEHILEELEDLASPKRVKAVNGYLQHFKESSECLERIIRDYPFLIKKYPFEPAMAELKMNSWEMNLCSKVNKEDADNLRKSATYQIVSTSLRDVPNEAAKLLQHYEEQHMPMRHEDIKLQEQEEKKEKIVQFEEWREEKHEEGFQFEATLPSVSAI